MRKMVWGLSVLFVLLAGTNARAWIPIELYCDAPDPPSESPQGYLYCSLYNGIEIVGYQGPSGDIVIPAVIDGRPVVSIGGYWITYMDDPGEEPPDEWVGAFQSHDGLVGVTIPGSVTNIEDSAFEDCANLVSLDIGSGVVSLPLSSVAGCNSLTEITVDENNPAYSSLDGVLYNKTKTVLRLYPDGRSGGFAIPDGVTGIGDSAFSGCTGLTGVTIPDSVTSIGDSAFSGCTGLTGVTIPDSVTSIGNSVFSRCTALSSATLGNGITGTSWSMFAHCSSLTGLPTGSSLASIGYYSFEDCDGLVNLIIPDGITRIGDSAFSGCDGLTDVTIPGSVVRIDDDAFRNCSPLATAYFLGSAPAMGHTVFDATAPDFHICYTASADGFTAPFWYGYPASRCGSADDCIDGSDCSVDYQCVDGVCVTTSQAASWTWMSGSKTVSAAGVYGTKGMPAAANVPGARYNSVSWTGGAGSMWLFGGRGKDSTGTDGFLNDLWSYEPDTDEWTWMSGSKYTDAGGVYGTKGVPGSANTPGARYGSISWTHSDGSLWLFGGRYRFPEFEGYDTYLLNDLWRYEPDIGMWTWMSGRTGSNYGSKGVPAAANMPPGRLHGISWLDGSDNLWLFGGETSNSMIVVDSEGLNDLWRYEPSTGMWTWMSGSNIHQQAGVYGTKGVPAAANVPGARANAVSWKDKDGNLWLFGGMGYHDCCGIYDLLNDLWRYEPATGMWTWMSGSDTFNQAGAYGTKGEPDASDVPGARSGAIAWTDSDGNLWFFGGFGYDVTGTGGNLNDLWRYEPGTGMWTWMGGANIAGQSGVYGTRGVPAAANVPGARKAAVSSTDNDGNVWLFGGYGYDSAGSRGSLNDLWRYTAPECLNDNGCPSGFICVDGRCAHPCDTAADCSDGLYCNGEETCDNGTCSAGSSPCEAGQYCLEETDSCAACLNDADCSDGLYCNGAETCNNGVCISEAVPCGTGYCDEAIDQCVGCLNDGHCADGLYCTGTETCISGSCNAGTPPVCDDGAYCNGVETCNEATDSCSAGTSPCSGATPVCDESGDRCLECLSDSQCDDYCVNNVCVECRNSADCTDGLYCNGAETCTAGVCGDGTAPCSGGTPYCIEATDSCVECRNAGDCSDGAYCNGAEICTAGVCGDGTGPCPDNTPYCLEGNDSCVECTSSSHCDDGYACESNACVEDCDLTIDYKPLLEEKLLKKEKKLKLKITGGEGFELNATVTVGSFSIYKKKPVVKYKNGVLVKNELQLTVIVPAGTPAGNYTVHMTPCSGTIQILESAL